jgi:hypothetical protein
VAGSSTEEEVAPGHDPSSGPRLHGGEGSWWIWEAPHERRREPPSRLAGVMPGHAGEQNRASWRELRRGCAQRPRPPGAPCTRREGGRAGSGGAQAVARMSRGSSWEERDWEGGMEEFKKREVDM